MEVDSAYCEQTEKVGLAAPESRRDEIAAEHVGAYRPDDGHLGAQAAQGPGQVRGDPADPDARAIRHHIAARLRQPCDAEDRDHGQVADNQHPHA